MKYEKGSFIVLPNKQVLHELSLGALAIYVHLCDYADEKGECWPSRETLATRISMSTDSVDRYLKELSERGLIQKENRTTQNGTLTSNLYALMLLPSRTHAPTPSRTHAAGTVSSLLTESNELIYVHDENEKPKKEKPDLDGFLAFWDVYPRRADKATASAEWRKLTIDERAIALSDVPQRAKTRLWSDPQYIPMPAKYLRDKRWQDELLVPKKIKSYG